MKTIRIGGVLFFLLFCLNLFSAGRKAECQHSSKIDNQNRIKPYPLNQYYWQYKGKPVLLLGGSVHNNLFQIADLETHLDDIIAAGGNYIRNTMNHRTKWNLPGDLMLPYAKIDNGKYDLNKWNDSYWSAFEKMLNMTEKRDIIVQLELWDYHDFAGNSWTTNAFMPGNNVNFAPGDFGLENTANDKPWKDLQPFFYTLPVSGKNKPLLMHQEAFVRKVLSYSLQHNNILYTIDNETAVRAEWGEYWAAFIRAEALRSGKHVDISEMWNDNNMNSDLHKRSYDNFQTYSFLDISQNNRNSDQAHWNQLEWVRNHIKNLPRPMNNTKIYSFGNTSWGSGDSQQGVERFWRNLIGGAGSCRFHRPPEAGIGLNNVAKNCISAARKLESKVPLWEVDPHMELLSDRADDEAYLAADPGHKYVLYFTKGGSVDLNLGCERATFTGYWINIDSGEWGSSEQIKGGDKISITAPGNGSWVIAIIKYDYGS